MTYTYVMNKMIRSFAQQDFSVARQLQEIAKKPTEKAVYTNRS